VYFVWQAVWPPLDALEMLLQNGFDSELAMLACVQGDSQLSDEHRLAPRSEVPSKQRMLMRGVFADIFHCQPHSIERDVSTASEAKNVGLCQIEKGQKPALRICELQDAVIGTYTSRLVFALVSTHPCGQRRYRDVEMVRGLFDAVARIVSDVAGQPKCLFACDGRVLC
jgi:hypothetical protein